jgi:cobalt-zinc-cadmium efflux system membrane fusion protein
MSTRQIALLAAVVLAVVAAAVMIGRRGGRDDVVRAADSGTQVYADDHEGHDHGEDAAVVPEDDHDGHGHGEAQGGNDAADPAIYAESQADADAGHDNGEAAAVVRLSERELEECGVTMVVAGPGWLGRRVVLPGEVRMNGDRMVHMVPRVPGIVREVRVTLGDEVRAGEVLAVLESNELADAKADFLAARERLTLAESNYEREKRLWEKEITSEQEYLDARREVTEARIAYRSSEQKLYALGLTEGRVADLTADGGEIFTRYEIRAPFAGTVVDKHITLGEKVGDESEIFVIADLSTVWVDLSVTQKDFPFLREGVEVTVSAGFGVPDAKGTIDYVSPVVGEATRTATARIVLPNADGQWRPGLFVSAKISIAETQVPVMIPKTAAQQLDQEWVVFVETDGGFEPVPVTLGRGDEDRVEVLAGLEPGRRYVAEGAFECKAKVVTSNMDPHAGHGH